MARKIVDGEKPQNARVNIDYSGKKPKVSFSYPAGKSGFQGSMWSTIQMYYVLLLILAFIAASSFDMHLQQQNVIDGYDKDSLQGFTLCAIQHPMEVRTNYSNVRYNLCEPTNEDSFYVLDKPWFLIIMALSCWIVPAIIYFPFRKKWNKLWPAHEAFFARKKYVCFKPKDVVNNLYDSDQNYPYFVELPVFANIILAFKARKDFCKYLKHIEIREHKFSSYKKKRIFPKLRGRRFRKQNEWVWYARFYFSEKPVKGKLEVIFK